MIRRPMFIFVISILSAAAISGASLRGSVADPQGRAVPSAMLTLYSLTGTAGSTTSAADGAYRFESLPEGTFLLRAEAPGFAPFLAENIHLAAGSAEIRAIRLEVAVAREHVVVTASTTPQVPERVSKAITAIDREDADARDASALSEVVALAPSVRVDQLGGPGALTTLRIRGMRDQDTAVLVDGLRLRDVSATQGDASALIEDLMFTNADRAEVMRGSGSSLYGTNAVGGVVNLITDEGGGRTRGSVLMEGGSLGAFRVRALLAGGLHMDRIQYGLGVAETDVTSGVGGDAPFRNTSVQGRITFHLSPSVRLTARLYGADSFGKTLGEPIMLGRPSGLGIVNAVPGTTFLLAPDNPDGTRASRFVSDALMLEGQASPALNYTVSYQLVSSSRRYGDGPAGEGYQPAGSTRSVYDGHIQTVNAQVHYSLGLNLLSVGYEFEGERFSNDNSDQSNPAALSAVNVAERSHTVFAEDQAQFLGGRLQVSGAVRAQFFSLDRPQFFPLESAPYQGIAFPAPTPAYTGDGSAAYFFRKTGTKLRAHVGRGYRAPSLFERFGAGFDPVYGYTVYGDPRLKPEHSIGLDAGIDQTFWRGRLTTSGSYFYTWLQNVINFDTSGAIDPATDPYGRFIGYANTEGGISRGFELSATAAPARSLRVTTAYTYVNALERTPIVGNVLQSFVIPRNQFSMVITERPTPRLLLTCDALAWSSYLAPIYGDVVTQTYRFGGLQKANFGASYRIPMKDYQAIRLFARFNNIFNQTYFESGFLTPGRTASAGLEWQF